MFVDPQVQKLVGVFPPEAMTAKAALFGVLATLFPVRFVPFMEGGPPVDGVLSICTNLKPARACLNNGVSVLTIPSEHRPELDKPKVVRFVGCPRVQPYLRGMDFRIEGGAGFVKLDHSTQSECVAISEEEPLWMECRNGKAVFMQVATGLPELREGQAVFPEMLKGGWLRWLPILHFLRGITAEIDWRPSGLRACFMFDDPNLHWSSWGHINFAELAAHAERNHYHASMATVPLDLWFTHRPTAAHFREKADYLSLLVHGVDHTYAEFQRPKASVRRAADLAWSLRKLAVFESRQGLKISRVMAPPHHACSIEAANLMLHSGYEAACVAWLALMKWNPDIAWRPDFGLWCGEFLGDGFPVLPRFNFAGQDRSRAVLAAFFHQPIIMVGHHQDLANGLDILGEWAALVNSMGKVRWTNLERLVRSNYLTRTANGILHVRMGARRVSVCMPAGTTQIVVERPWMTAGRKEVLQIAATSGAQVVLDQEGMITEPLAMPSGATLEIVCPPEARPAGTDAGRPLVYWPITRRLLCEARDRIQPQLHKVRSFFAPKG